MAKMAIIIQYLNILASCTLIHLYNAICQIHLILKMYIQTGTFSQTYAFGPKLCGVIISVGVICKSYLFFTLCL